MSFAVRGCFMSYVCNHSRLLYSLLALVVFTAIFATAQEAEAPFTGVSLSVQSATVPPGGLLQMQVFVTEPNPILKGKQGARYSTSRAAVLSPFAAAPPAVLGSIRDGALYSPGGDVSGVAVGKTGGTQVYFTSPLTSFGTIIDTPVMTIAIPVSKNATVGQTVNLDLDPAN